MGPASQRPDQATDLVPYHLEKFRWILQSSTLFHDSSTQK